MRLTSHESTKIILSNLDIQTLPAGGPVAETIESGAIWAQGGVPAEFNGATWLKERR